MSKSTRLKPAMGVLTLSILLGGCASLEPSLPNADPAIAGEWPMLETTEVIDVTPGAADAPVADIGWREFFADQDLQALIGLALDNNRDLRVAVLNVERARAQYRIQRADRLPAVAAGAALARAGGDNNNQAGDVYSAELGLVAFEFDLFGRVRSLSQAALQQYFAQEEAWRAAQLSLIAEVANAYLALATDRELLRIAHSTLEAFQVSFELNQKRHDLGAASTLDLIRAQTQVESARADVARYQGFIARDINALTLLIGSPVASQRLPAGFDGQVTGLLPLPAGLPSAVLQRRPDVLQAEHRLRAANADIGAARAAFFPSVTLTGSVGTASDELSGLFASGSRIWRFMPQINVPIFQGGRLRAGLDTATADRDIALARYEKSVQTGFREVADALALTHTLTAQRQAQQAMVDAAQRADELAKARYAAGRDSYLVRLDTQRTLYAAQQGLAIIRLAEQVNRVTLYKVLGGGWKEHS